MRREGTKRRKNGVGKRVTEQKRGKEGERDRGRKGEQRRWGKRQKKKGETKDG